ncbi:MAG: 1-deoxy-D-xylulose-5-phosphate reductoisomerase [Candidatus Omnitrophota bacterium]
MKRIAVFGSTGSIGRNTLEVIRHFPDKFKVAGLSTNSNVELLSRQVEEFRPGFACINEPAGPSRLKSRALPGKLKVFSGTKGPVEAIREEAANIDLIVMAISGSDALWPLLEALKQNKDVALANKEALVSAGEIIMDEAAKNKASIIPIDSEQSAIWQCLSGQDKKRLKQIYLTASGGPFLKKDKEELKKVSVNSVLKHPRWKMGRKITVDSATLMNKGLELLEAMFLFGLKPDKIKILIHPQSLVHSMVEFVDGVVLAQLSATDMRIPIQYALSYPERLSNSLPVIDFYKLGKLEFLKPDCRQFPCLRLAYQAAGELGTMPCVLNAANETAVSAFLKKELPFLSIARIIERVMEKHQNKKPASLDDIMHADTWARNEAKAIIARLN